MSWHDGTTLLVMSPLESMQRLAALVSRRLAPTSDCFTAVKIGSPISGLGRQAMVEVGNSGRSVSPVADVSYLA